MFETATWKHSELTLANPKMAITVSCADVTLNSDVYLAAGRIFYLLFYFPLFNQKTLTEIIDLFCKGRSEGNQNCVYFVRGRTANKTNKST